MKIIDALKELGKKCNTSQTAPTGDSIAEIIGSIAENFNITGAAGASVTAIALVTTEGAVTGGTATLSNGTEVTITVTEAEAETEG